jgi:purine-binding chemotaxis protein CheW
MTESTTSATASQYLTFFVAREEYAIDVLRVREVIGLVPFTRVPSTPSDVRGVVNLRGSVIPVVDLGLRFGAGELASTRRTCIVVVEPDTGSDRVVGLLVDSVNRVVTLGSADLVPVPPFGTKASSEMLAGMGVVGSAFVLILVPEHAARIEARVVERAS